METTKIKDFIFSYGFICGKRNNESQKKKFLRLAKKQFEQFGYDVHVTKAKLSCLRLETKNFYNLYAGDVKHAKMIFVTYYDTPIKTWVPVQQVAFQPGISKMNVYINMAISIIFLLAALSIFYIFLFPHLNRYGFLNIWGIFTLCISLFTFLFIKHTRCGIANRNNLTRNTSSIISFITLASQLRKDQKQNVAFVFLDEGTNSEYGLKMLDAYLGTSDPLKVYMDSISNKGQLHCFTNLDLHCIFHEDELHALNDKQKQYGDILLTAGNFINGKVIVTKEKSSKKIALDVHIIKHIVMRLHKLLTVIVK